MQKWQQKWDYEIKGRPLYMIQNKADMESKKGKKRKEKVIKKLTEDRTLQVLGVNNLRTRCLKEDNPPPSQQNK